MADDSNQLRERPAEDLPTRQTVYHLQTLLIAQAERIKAIERHVVEIKCIAVAVGVAIASYSLWHIFRANP